MTKAKKILAVLIAVSVLIFLFNIFVTNEKPPIPIPLPKKIEEKKKQVEDKKRNAPKEQLIASYTTKFTDNTMRLREQNIKSTVNLINNKIINPRQEFSFNRTIGEITSAKGFVPAPIIGDNGQLIPGMGGGMCQVTSTLYNAVLEANLKVLERHSHSLPVSYVPKGRDATVYDDKDFRFRNNQKKPVKITGQVVNNTVKINIYQLAPQ